MIFNSNLAQFQCVSFKPAKNILLIVFRLFIVMGHFKLFTKTCIVRDSRFCPFFSKIPVLKNYLRWLDIVILTKSLRRQTRKQNLTRCDLK